MMEEFFFLTLNKDLNGLLNFRIYAWTFSEFLYVFGLHQTLSMSNFRIHLSRLTQEAFGY